MKLIHKILTSSFFSGFSRALDLGNVSEKFQYSRDDAKALQSDWEQVGNDIRNSMIYYDKQSK